jgi:hypothetical protein
MLRSSKTSKAGWHTAWQQRGIYFSKSHVGMALQVGGRRQLQGVGSVLGGVQQRLPAPRLCFPAGHLLPDWHPDQLPCCLCPWPSPCPQAYEDQLLDLEALHRVCIASEADFRRVWARYGGRHAGRNLGRALKHLNADLRAANYVLPSRLQVPLLAVPGLTEGESLPGSRLPPPSPARSEALSDLSAFGQSVLH